MKSLLVVCGLFLALCVTPAVADTIGFTNQGLMAASGTGGVTALSTVTGLSLNGIPQAGGPFGLMVFSTGSLVGSVVTGGTFSAGSLAIQIASFDSAIFAGDFSGTWSKLGDDMYKLLGTFTTTFDGLSYHGSTTQLFAVEFDDGQANFRDVNGSTTITTVPEPGTLALLGTGFVSLAGAIRRKFRVAAE